MNTLILFIMSLLGVLVIGWPLLVLTVNAFGDVVGWLVVAFLTVGVLVALLVCVLDKLTAVEKKLDKLLEMPEREQARREAAYRETARIEQLLSEQEAGGGEGPA